MSRHSWILVLVALFLAIQDGISPPRPTRSSISPGLSLADNSEAFEHLGFREVSSDMHDRPIHISIAHANEKSAEMHPHPIPTIHIRDDEKGAWPELKDKPVDEAIQAIKTEYPHLNVIKMKQGSIMTMDYRLDRVRVFYDEHTNKVIQEPRRG